LEIAQAIAKYDAWNEENIKDRAKKLTEKILAVWDFDNPSRA
jgi:hypothetical protein